MNPIALALLQGGVGFAIGAGTNDLAIRWIFHAVFAKKKREIGESVRDVISGELMTPDKVATRLASPESAAALQAAIEKHLDGILGYWKHGGASNARTEGFNNKIRWLIRQAYGFRDREYFKLKIYALPETDTSKSL